MDNKIIFLVIFAFSSCYALERLSHDVYPTKYDLIIYPKFEEDFTYQGDLTIHLVTRNDTTYLTLDSEGLNITTADILIDGIFPVSATTVQKNNLLIIQSKILLKSTYKIELNLKFYGKFGKGLDGFYLSKYNYKGIDRYLGSTQFEALGARKAFPCFNDPSFRADFLLQIQVNSTMRAISNSPIVSETIEKGLRKIVFGLRQFTPVYLVAWVIYDIESFGSNLKNVKTNCDTNSSLNYSIWYNKQYENLTSLALNVAPHIVSALENFTGVYCEAVKYKMDLVAIPDFQAGAMENWELLTFRESALLYNNISSSTLDKQTVIMIVAHELVHQWFGDLVTLEWWSYTWLNEGFARYLQYVIADQLNPEMGLKEQFLIDRRQLALQTDALKAHELTYRNITSEDLISDMFDVITYDKGASVIHMWKSALGDEDFRIRVNNYLASSKNTGVAKPDNLFTALFDNSTFNDKLIGTTWTEQSGYPIVVVDEHNSTLIIKQIKVTGWNKTTAGQWLIPLTINIDEKKHIYQMKPNETTIIGYSTNSSYLINENQAGFFRVFYKNIKRWIPTNATDLIRSMLIDDALSLSSTGVLSYNVSLMVAETHLSSSTGYLPWFSGLRAFKNIGDLLKNSELEQHWQNLTLSWMNDVMEKVALNDSLPDNHVLRLHRMNLLQHGCNYGHEGCLEEANKLASNLSYAATDKKNALLCTVVRLGNNSTWNQIYQLYLSSNSPTEQQLYLKSLVCTRNRITIRRYLQLIFTENIRKHDIIALINLICENPVGADETLQFLLNNYNQIYNHFGEARSIKKIFTSANKFINDSQLTKIQEKSSILKHLNMNKIINNLEISLTYKNNHIKLLRAYLKPGYVEVTTTTTTEKTKPQSSSSHKTKPNMVWLIPLLTIFIIFHLNKI